MLQLGVCHRLFQSEKQEGRDVEEDKDKGSITKEDTAFEVESTPL